jgi:hypothetical protein
LCEAELQQNKKDTTKTKLGGSRISYSSVSLRL